MKRCAFLTFVVLVMLSAQLFAFDGQRKGFVLGGGLGFSPVGRWSVADNQAIFGGKTSESRPGIAANILIGYAFDNNNMIVYDGDATAYSSTFNDKISSQGADVFAWYHYFGPCGKSAFTTAGIGLYVFSVEEVGDFSSNLGFLFGGGYEFARHWQVGAYL